LSSIAHAGAPRYGSRMETPEEIRVRWRYLRDLLIEQLGRFESGSIQMRHEDTNVSTDAIWVLKQSIQDFDALITESEDKDAERPSRGEALR